MKKIIAIAGFLVLGTGAFAQQTKPAQSNSTSRTDTMNRNTDRAIGNKRDNSMVTDTASGGNATPPHAKTPESVKEKASSENSMALPDPSTTYNRSSNGGLGTDHLPKNTDSKSTGKEKQNSGKMNKTTAPAAGESHTGGSAATNSSGKTKMGTTGTGYSTGSHAGENSGNTQPKTSGQGKVKRDSIR